MIKRLERLNNTVNKYMADIRPVRTEVSRKSTTKCNNKFVILVGFDSVPISASSWQTLLYYYLNTILRTQDL
jgi:hypothetical protein